MYYLKEVTTPAGTSQSSPQETRFRAAYGVINDIMVYFPAGSQGFLRCSIWHGGHQIYPHNEKDDFVGDDMSWHFRDHYKLSYGYNQIIIKTWNEDDKQDHVVVVGLSVLSEELLLPAKMFTVIAATLQALLRRVGVVT